MTKIKMLNPSRYTFWILMGALFLSLSIIQIDELQAVETIPDFTIDTLDGKFTLSEHLGRTVVLFFSFVG